MADTCPFCHEQIPDEDAQPHRDGIDRSRLDCPHQDLEAIKEADRPSLWHRFDDAW